MLETTETSAHFRIPPHPEIVATGGTLHHQPKREIYVARPFVVYRDEIERCYTWFVERCQTHARRQG